MINIDAGEVAALPVDQLGLAILDDLIATDAWNEYNYLLEAGNHYGPGPALDVIAEALGWLRARALIARKPG